MGVETNDNLRKESGDGESPEHLSLAGGNDEGSNEPTSTCTPYRPFPRVMNFYSQMNLSGLKYAHLCGDKKEDRLFVFGVHTGYSGSTPLGSRPGLILHNGLGHKDPILAGACDESQWAARVYAFDLKSSILLPPVEAVPGARDMVSELMTTKTNDEGGISYLFTIEAGQGDKMERRRFEWRQFKKGTLDGIDKDGFKLLSPSLNSEDLGESSTGPSTTAAEDMSESADGGPLAMITWAKLGSKINHPLSLEFADDTVAVLFGKRWALMVVITALRLWALRMNGRGKKSIVAIAEKIRGKSAT
ncbi:uncharacterized protein PG986_012234 [Apiospora aurea]|uniref:Uncharacterized protein n=1 Tax=Apiospora aurea TaxID=335848 RepID=A0ABR1PZF0_9PEZI